MVILGFALLRKRGPCGIISPSLHGGARIQSQECVAGGCALEDGESFYAHALSTCSVLGAALGTEDTAGN